VITYDYTLERDLGNNKNQIFKPDKIPCELPNLVYIEGPNSSGKSTLLNIFALSMYGNKSRKINDLLQKKIRSLLDSDYQYLYFEVKIENKDKSLKIISRKEKDSREINVFESENGGREKPLSPEKFEDKYNLIYDIPNNPTERLRELTREIKEDQQRYGSKVANLRTHIHEILKEIEEGRNPKRLEYLKATLKQLEKDKNKLEEKREKLQTIQEILTTYTYCKYFLHYLNQCRHFGKQIENLQNQSKGIVKVGQKTTNDYRKLEKEIENFVAEIDEQFQTSISLLNIVLPKTEQNHLIIWNRIYEKLYDTITDFEFPEKFEGETTYLYQVLNEIKMCEEKKESLQEAKIISELLDFLNEYKNSNMILPGAEISLTDFVKALECKMKQNQDVIDRANNILLATNLLEKLHDLRIKVEKKLPQLRKLADTKVNNSGNSFEIDEIESSISKYKESLRENENMYNFYVEECIKKDIDINSISDEEIKARIRGFEINKDLSPYLIYKEKELRNKINQFEIELEGINKEISNKSLHIESYGKDIERLEAKEPHKYQEYVNILSELYLKTGLIHQNLCKNYDKYIDQLMSDNPKKDLIDKKYSLEISKYLAKRIGTFHHIDTEYTANNVDLISREIITIEGQIIRFNDMGSGQSQSAYLKGLLNTEDDKRKIIALFDEVAMMDNCSLEPIYKKFKELYEEGRLLVGIVVQKADNVNVISKI
jgi:exonuclease SbcC